GGGVAVGAARGAVDVDLARVAGERLDQDGVEVVPRLRGEELEDAVGGIRRDAKAEPGQHPPVDALARVREVVDRCDEEREVKDELADPLPELRQRLRRLEVVEADQINEQEGREE